METTVKKQAPNPLNMVTVVETPLTTMARGLAAASTVLLMASETLDRKEDLWKDTQEANRMYLDRIVQLEAELKARPDEATMSAEYRKKFEMLESQLETMQAERDELRHARIDMLEKDRDLWRNQLEAEKANVAGYEKDLARLQETVIWLRAELAKHDPVAAVFDPAVAEAIRVKTVKRLERTHHDIVPLMPGPLMPGINLDEGETQW